MSACASRGDEPFLDLGAPAKALARPRLRAAHPKTASAPPCTRITPEKPSSAAQSRGRPALQALCSCCPPIRHGCVAAAGPRTLSALRTHDPMSPRAAATQLGLLQSLVMRTSAPVHHEARQPLWQHCYVRKLLPPGTCHRPPAAVSSLGAAAPARYLLLRTCAWLRQSSCLLTARRWHPRAGTRPARTLRAPVSRPYRGTAHSHPCPSNCHTSGLEMGGAPIGAVWGTAIRAPALPGSSLTVWSRRVVTHGHRAPGRHKRRAAGCGRCLCRV